MLHPDSERVRRADSTAAYAVLLLILTALVVVFSPVTFLDRDQALYFVVAWHSFGHGSYFWPTLPEGGGVYLEKPPLLFWLYTLGWKLFGVGTLYPRMLQALLLLGNALLCEALVREVWASRPAGESASRSRPLASVPRGLVAALVMATVLTVSQIHHFKFDNLMMFWILSIWYATCRFIHTPRRRPLLYLLLANVLALLTKGPFVFLYTLPGLALVALRAGIRDSSYRYLRVLVPTAGAVVLVFGYLWWEFVFKTDSVSHLSYLTAGQVDRRISLFHKPHLVHFFRALMLLLPWSLIPAAWRGLWRIARRNRADTAAYVLSNASFGFLFVFLFVTIGGGDRYVLPFVYGMLVLLLAGLWGEHPAFFGRGLRWLAITVAALSGLAYLALLGYGAWSGAFVFVIAKRYLPWFAVLGCLIGLAVWTSRRLERGGVLLSTAVLFASVVLAQVVVTAHVGENAFYRKASALHETLRPASVVLLAQAGQRRVAQDISRGLFFHLQLRRPPPVRYAEAAGGAPEHGVMVLFTEWRAGGHGPSACPERLFETRVLAETLSQSWSLHPRTVRLVLCVVAQRQS